MKLSDFDYSLPEDLIAQQPPDERGDSRLLVVGAGDVDGDDNPELIDSQFSQLGQWISEKDLLVFNNTRVIPARLFGQKITGGKIEVLVERVVDDRMLFAHIRASKSPKPGTLLILEEAINCEVFGRKGEFFVLKLVESGNWLELLEQYGHIPLPPYIQREDNNLDKDRYQTVFAENPGAVAAPTAGLHFTQKLLDELSTKGCKSCELTLHVGAGTFQPVRGETIDDHVMHSEWINVPQSVCDAIEATRQNGGRVIAVGTTVVRSLETASASGRIQPFCGDSSIFIKPGYEFKSVDAMITNFHLPRSTLLMLVSAFTGHEFMHQAYKHAVDHKYRFFSYGDAMLLSSKGQRSVKS